MVQTARLFLAGSSIYPALELLYRKKTHVSMAVAGGTSLCFINKVCNGLLKQKSLPVKCVAGFYYYRCRTCHRFGGQCDDEEKSLGLFQFAFQYQRTSMSSIYSHLGIDYHTCSYDMQTPEM